MPVDEEQLIRELDAMPPEEPPGDLRSSIMAGIAAERPAARPVAFTRRPRRFVFAAGWGVAALIVLTFLVLVRPPSGSEPYATMAPIATEYTAGDVTVSVWREGDLVRVQPRLTGIEPVTITVRWDPQSAAFAGIYGATDASSQNNQMTFTLFAPSQRSVVSLGVHPAARATAVVVLVNEVEAIRAEVPLN